MFRSYLCMAAALSLAACAAPGTVASAPSSPADTSASTDTAPIDAQAITVAFQALDTAATAADALIFIGAIKPGTPNALKLANGLDGAKTWLNIASAAQRAGRAKDYITAIAQASAAIAGAQAALKGN